MTREQAINYLFSSGFTNEQVGDVVRALTYEPTTKNDSSELEKNSKKLEKGATKNDLGVDCISRQATINAVKRIHPVDTDYDCTLYDKVDVMYVLDEMPSVTPQLSVPEVTALAEWTAKLTKASEDAYNKGYADGMKAQEPRKGHWISHREHCENIGVMPSGLSAYEWCSNCDCGIDVREWYRNRYNFCPNCGADMREVEE